MNSNNRHLKYKALKSLLKDGEKNLTVYVISTMEQNGYTWYSVTKDICKDVYIDEGEMYAMCEYNFEVNINALFLNSGLAIKKVSDMFDKALRDGK